MGWEVGGGYRIGNSCTPMADSVNVWQNQYSIVKQNKVKIKIKKKKIRDTKGTFHVKMDTIKDKKGMDLTEAEDIEKR